MARKKLTQPSYLWAGAIVLGISKWFNREEEHEHHGGGGCGCLSLIDIPFKIPIIGWFLALPFRLYIANRYLSDEGVWINRLKWEVELILQNVNEPKSMSELFAFMFGLGETAIVQRIKVYARTIDVYEPRTEAFGAWTYLIVGQSSGNTELIGLTIGGIPSSTIIRIKRAINAAYDKKDEDDLQHEIETQYIIQEGVQDLRRQKREWLKNNPQPKGEE